jgi:pSer/pThr/pTyr-binding forkhead associated (FHA) protein
VTQGGSSAFLQVISGPREGLTVPLRDGESVTIGRKRGELLLSDPLVSGRHCRIGSERGQVTLRDLGSTNGTLVDGRLVREAVLKPGSEVTVGSCKMILFVGEDPQEDQPAARQSPSQLDIAWLLDEELVELQGSADRTRTHTDVIGQDLRLPPGVNAAVEVVAGQDAGQVYRFTRGNVSIGRRQGEVPLSDVEVSRRHAVIELFGREMVFLRDLRSTNGTYHNGRRISVSKLRDGDTVGVGKTVMKLRLTR